VFAEASGADFPSQTFVWVLPVSSGRSIAGGPATAPNDSASTMIKYFSLKQEKKAEADAAAAAGADGKAAKKPKAAHLRVQKGTAAA